MRHTCLVALLMASAASAAPPGPGAVAATVNGEAVPLAAVEAEVQRAQALAGPLSDRQARRLRREAVEELIDDALVRQYLRAQTPPPTPADIERHWRALLDALKRRGTTLEAYAKASGRAEPELRARFAAQLHFDLFLDSLATEARLRQYYADHAELFDGRKARVGLIALRLPADAPAGERAAAVARLGAIRGEILAGRRTFAEAAALYSSDASAVRGGDCGLVGARDGLLDPAVTAAAHALPVGAVSAPVETPGSVVLVTASAKEPGRPPSFEAAADWVREEFAADVRARLVAKLRAKASVAVTVGE